MFLNSMPRTTRLLVIAAAVSACWGREPSSPSAKQPTDGAAFAKGTSGTSVALTSLAPDSSSISTTLDVHLYGNGFTNDMGGVWGLQGVPDSTQIKTNSTRFVSAKELVANITISSTAAATSWDVMIFSGTKTGIGTEQVILKSAFRVTDPTATWKFPLDDATLNLKSDGLYGDGTNSVYANGVCNISTTIFATSAPSNSGDATINSGTGSGKCRRHFVIAYPDGVNESFSSFNNLRELENTSFSIPIGQTVERMLAVNPGAVSNSPSRCGTLYFGYGVKAGNGPGSDSLLVTRLDARTWQVRSQAAPNDRAYCQNNGKLYELQVNFVIVSSRPLS